MRSNLPVTQREYTFPEGATLMSSTDKDSYLTYANEAFIQVSGFTPEELMGQPHNLVRHPDMPKEAFADMWATLKAGMSWTSLVKNRRKDGDHYWVRANATPVVREGRVVGYMSVRTQPSREEVQAAEQAYAAFRDQRAGSRRFHRGLIVHGGWSAWRSLGQTMPLSWRLRLAIFGVVALAMIGGVLAGLDAKELGIIAGLMLVGSVLKCWLVEQQIVGPLKAVLAQAQAVAAGQAGQNLHLNRVDEIGMLMRAVNQSGLNLRSLVDDVGEQVHGVRQASEEFAAGNRELSERTEQASERLQQTASSMSEMTVAVRANSDTARAAASLAGDAHDAASKGGEVVQRVVDTMHQISASSKRIADIIGVIDGIAFQTNILALNAAVEAARAGEQGRGFAVVAGEVRSLAQRSASAAREIKQLIQDSVERVSVGSALVDDAGQSMAAIVGKVGEVNTLIEQISRASAEQLLGIDQVTQAVSALDHATQQNTQLVAASAEAANGLQTRAGRLSEAINVFKSDGHPAPTAPSDHSAPSAQSVLSALSARSAHTAHTAHTAHAAHSVRPAAQTHARDVAARPTRALEPA
ncbi:methyl-accepting chemotaxis protein [Roseateles depolymerans]|uniref:Aerotaxis sensor receptor transmembrane protein n=1 Tax=Roseateles depolymerans TaxID=76731 RepID=A0A0U2U545_9BURK|nr:PAS domain-containing methyl-accepting chemotaxis protein [Roseateles depolymerans]ALV07169.1 Aerotaxis sensor receptor transmembrane protein [Roseateles depolymerans]REG20152.1 methyl-accepting chemotaxis sensory transducer with Pas/Pac sensor [Roseateles depolymerans]